MSRLLPKHRFEEIKREQRQAKLDKRRKVAIRNVSVSFLIVCEGERTEPNYFKALIKDRYSDIREVTIEGKGQGTVSLIKETIAINQIKSLTGYGLFLIKMTLMISITPYSLQKRIIFFAHGLMSHSNFGIIYIFNIWILAYPVLNTLRK